MLSRHFLALAAATAFACFVAANPVAAPEPTPAPDPEPAPYLSVGPTAASIILSDLYGFNSFLLNGASQASAFRQLLGQVDQALSSADLLAAAESFKSHVTITLADFVNGNPTPHIAPQISKLPSSLAEAYIRFESAVVSVDHAIAVSVAKSVDHHPAPMTSHGGGSSASPAPTQSAGGGGSGPNPFRSHHGAGGGSSTAHNGNGGQHSTTTPRRQVTVVRTVTPTTSSAMAPANTGVVRAAGLALGAVGAAAFML